MQGYFAHLQSRHSISPSRLGFLKTNLRQKIFTKTPKSENPFKFGQIRSTGQDRALGSVFGQNRKAETNLEISRGEENTVPKVAFEELL